MDLGLNQDRVSVGKGSARTVKSVTMSEIVSELQGMAESTLEGVVDNDETDGKDSGFWDGSGSPSNPEYLHYNETATEVPSSKLRAESCLVPPLRLPSHSNGSTDNASRDPVPVSYAPTPHTTQSHILTGGYFEHNSRMDDLSRDDTKAEVRDEQPLYSDPRTVTSESSTVHPSPSHHSYHQTPVSEGLTDREGEPFKGIDSLSQRSSEYSDDQDNGRKSSSQYHSHSRSASSQTRYSGEDLKLDPSSFEDLVKSYRELVLTDNNEAFGSRTTDSYNSEKELPHRRGMRSRESSSVEVSNKDDIISRNRRRSGEIQIGMSYDNIVEGGGSYPNSNIDNLPTRRELHEMAEKLATTPSSSGGGLQNAPSQFSPTQRSPVPPFSHAPYRSESTPVPSRLGYSKFNRENQPGSSGLGSPLISQSLPARQRHRPPPLTIENRHNLPVERPIHRTPPPKPLAQRPLISPTASPGTPHSRPGTATTHRTPPPAPLSERPLLSTTPSPRTPRFQSSRPPKPPSARPRSSPERSSAPRALEGRPSSNPPLPPTPLSSRPLVPIERRRPSSPATEMLERGRLRTPGTPTLEDWERLGLKRKLEEGEKELEQNLGDSDNGDGGWI